MLHTLAVLAGAALGNCDKVAPATLDTPPVQPAADPGKKLDRESEPVKPAREGRLLICKEGKIAFLTPEGKQIGELSGNPDNTYVYAPAISPDGKQVAFIANGRRPIDKDGTYLRHVFIRNLEGKADGIKLEVKAQNIMWTPDGKLVAVEAASFRDVRDRKFTTWLVNVATKEKSRLELPESTQVLAATPDGKSFIALTLDSAEKKLYLTKVSQDGKTAEKLTGINLLNASFAKPKLSPDGSRVLYLDTDNEEKLEKEMLRLPRLFTYDLKTRKSERVADVPLNALIQSFVWSPDSRKIAYSWKRLEPGVPLAANLNDLNNPKLKTETESHLTVAAASGKDARTVFSAKAPTSVSVIISDLDWR